MSAPKSKKVSITQKIANLDERTEWFYGDDFQIDQALVKYNEAIKLADEIKKDLSELKNQVEVIEDFTKS